MSRRRYIVNAPSNVRKDRVIAELVPDGKGGEQRTEILGLPKDLPPEYWADILSALRRAYEAGREERSAELIPDEKPSDLLRRTVLYSAVGAISGWATGWTEPEGDDGQYYISQEDGEEGDNELVLGIVGQRYDVVKRFRVRVLAEEIEP